MFVTTEAIGNLTLFVTHWLFTSTYFVTANLLKLWHEEKSMDEMEKAKKRRFYLDIGIYVTSVVVVVVSSIIASYSSFCYLVDSYIALMYWWLTVIAGWSFWQIRKKAQDLKSMGILVDKKFLTGYFGFMLACAVLSSVKLALALVGNTCNEGNLDNLSTLFTVVECLQSVLVLILHLMMILVCKNYSYFNKQNSDNFT